MRTKAIFSVFGRKLPSKRVVFYYQCYDEKGKRQFAKSTGFTKKTEAVAYCTRLFRDGLLIPQPKVPTFAEYSEGWWDIETCRYLKWRQLHDPMAQVSIYVHKMNFDNHIKGYFAKYRLDEITPNVIEGWLLFLSEKTAKEEKAGKAETCEKDKKTEKKKTLKPKTINLIYVTLQVMLGEAARTKVLKVNPCKEVKKLRTEEIVRDILTIDEARKLFPPE